MSSEKELPRRLAPTVETLRALFAKSSNQCAYPGCNEQLIDDEDNKYYGNICHIEDANPGGRFNEDMSNEDRRNFNNLILFCYKHHKKTDDFNKYSVVKLKEIKANHENKVLPPCVPSESVLMEIFNDLKADVYKIKEDTSVIKETTSSIKEDTSELKFLINTLIDREKNNSEHINAINTILKLRESNNQNSLIKLLEDYKTEHWDNLNDIEKYKLIANIGISYVELNEQTKAAEYFIKAFEFNKDDENALGLAAVGYSILGNVNNAQIAIEKVLQNNPKNVNAYISLIMLYKDKTLDEVISIIPDEVKENSDIAYSLGVFSRLKNNLSSSIYWFEKAVENSTKNNSDIKARLASTVLESINDPFQFFTGEINNETRNKIKYCVDLLTTAWDQVKNTDLRYSRNWILINRGVAKKYLQDFNGAKEDFQLANELNENYLSIKNLALLAFGDKNYDIAFEMSAKLNNFNVDIEQEGVFNIELFNAHLFFGKKDFTNAILLLEDLINQENRFIVKYEAKGLLIHTYIAVNRLDEAKKLCLSIIESSPDYIRGYIDAFKVFSSIDGEETHFHFLNTAFEKVENSESIDIQDLAFIFLHYKQYPKAIKLLEKIAKPGIYSNSSKALLEAFYKNGDYGKALDLCKSIQENYSPIDFITEKQSLIYESIGDLEKAIITYNNYLVVYPDDQTIKIRLAILYARLKDKRLKDILNTLTLIGNISIEALYVIAYLNIEVDNIEKGLEIALLARKKYYQIGDAHLKYVGFVFKYKNLHLELRNPNVIGLDSIIQLKYENGETQHFHIIDESDGSTFSSDLIISDKLAQLVLGKSVGDIVSIENSIGKPQLIEIVNIFDKYFYAFRESINLLSTKFVGINGFRVFTIGDTGDPKEDFKPFFDILDKGEEHVSRINEYYNENVLPIGAVSQLRKQNPIKVWEYTVGNIDLGVYCGIDDLVQQNEIETLLASQKDIVLDLISLLTLKTLNKLELLTNITNRKIVSRSLIETIDEHISDLKSIGLDGYLTIGKDKDQYFRSETTVEENMVNAVFYEDIIKWINDNCEILPCNFALNINAGDKSMYDNHLSKSSIDSILLAKENNSLLLSDEANFRSTALSEFDVKSFSNYNLFHYCWKINLINKNSFTSEVANLIRLNYKCLPIDSSILLRCTELANYENKFPFDLAIKSFEAKVAEEDSCICVASDYFYNLYQIDLPSDTRNKLIIPILQVLVKNRNSKLVLTKMGHYLKEKYALSIEHFNELGLIFYQIAKGVD
jgi:tetratricopeptide (TPR) repeat protein